MPNPIEVAIAKESGDKPWAAAWESLWDAEEKGEVYSEKEVAESLRRRFLQQGIVLEIIYAEILGSPIDLEQYPHGSLWATSLETALTQVANRSEKFSSRPEGIVPLGFDLSTPEESFHSALFHPGLADVCPDLRGCLNTSGLLDDFDVARRLLRRALAMDYGVSPFCIFGIWLMSAG